MRWLLLGLVACSAFPLSGCDVLFPEFAGGDAAVPRDGGMEDGGSSPMLAGVVCILGDVRDYKSCATGSPGVLRVTVEETRQQTMTDVAGHFTLPLSQKLATATVAAVDPAGNFAPSVVPVRLTNGAAAGIALPVVAVQTLMSIELANGVQDDPDLGTLLAWAVDPSGAPVAGVTTNSKSALYDDNAPNTLSAGTATHQDGTIALFTVSPTSLMLTLTPPPTSPLSADTFTLPIRSGAVTATTLVLPPR
jgi:hypothetical protein